MTGSELIPIALTLLFALSVYLIYDGLTAPGPWDPGEFLARRLAGLRLRLADFLAGAGLHDVSVREFLIGSIASGLLVAVLSELILGWAVVAALAFAVGLFVPFAYYAARRDRRRAEIQRSLADAIDGLRLSVQAGRSVPEALAALAELGPEALRPEFAVLARDQRLLGLPAALSEMKGRLADPVFDVVALALSLSEETGGRNLTVVLDELARAVRGQLRVQEEVRAQQGRNRLAAQIIAALPLVILVLVRAIDAEYLAVYDTFAGQLVIGLAALMIASGYLLMLRLGRLPSEERVFR